ncbi:hypothetical protein IWQ61_007471 [Dispira simplex]|nr:hypothetical protein IWQ61_007471 [Dispira simplex]
MPLPKLLQQVSPRLLVGLVSVVVIPTGLWIGTRLGESSENDVIVVDPKAPETPSEVKLHTLYHRRAGQIRWDTWHDGFVAKLLHFLNLAAEERGMAQFFYSKVDQVGCSINRMSTLLEQRHALLAEKEEKLAKLRKFEEEVAQRDGIKSPTTTTTISSTTELERK